MTHHWEMVKLSFKSSQVLQILLKKVILPNNNQQLIVSDFVRCLSY